LFLTLNLGVLNLVFALHMSVMPPRFSFRESRGLVTVCAIVVLVMGVVLARWPRPVKEEKIIARKQAGIMALKSRGESVPTGAYPKVEEYVRVWLRRGWKADTWIAGMLLLASPWLGRRRREGMKFLSRPEMGRLTRWQVAGVIGLMLLAAWHNWPRLFHSMWGDEEFNASRFILDEVSHGEDGSIRITPRPWATTLWSMRKPTNHLGYSTLARLTHDAFFEKKDGADDPWFSEALLRAPVFVAGLLLIPGFVWALRVWGLRPWWGLALVLFHPWFTRFGVDGRGYGFIMLGAALMLGALGRALQTGRWAWWIAFGFCGFFQVWSNLQGVYPVAALNLVAALCLWRGDATADSRRLLAARWVVANALTLMLVVGWLAPCWPQLQEFMARGEIHGDLDWRFWKDGLCAWCFGQPYHPWDGPENPLRYALEISMLTMPWLHVVGIALFGALLVIGLGSLCRNKSQCPLLLFALGAPAIMLLHMQLTDNRPYDWYFCPFVPGLFLIAAAGSSWFSRPGTGRSVRMALLGGTVALFAFITRDARAVLRSHPIEPSRESVSLYRTIVNPRNPDFGRGIMSGGFAFYTEGYDPALHRFHDAAGLRALMEEADRSGRKFFINTGMIGYDRDFGFAGICELLDDSARFEHVATLHGLLRSTTREVYRYRGRADQGP
jgi:hypothetical protein